MNEWEEAQAIKRGEIKLLYVEGHNHKKGHAISLVAVDAKPVRFVQSVDHARNLVMRFNRRFGHMRGAV